MPAVVCSKAAWPTAECAQSPGCSPSPRARHREQRQPTVTAPTTTKQGVNTPTAHYCFGRRLLHKVAENRCPGNGGRADPYVSCLEARLPIERLAARHAQASSHRVFASAFARGLCNSHTEKQQAV